MSTRNDSENIAPQDGAPVDTPAATPTPAPKKGATLKKVGTIAGLLVVGAGIGAGIMAIVKSAGQAASSLR